VDPSVGLDEKSLAPSGDRTIIPPPSRATRNRIKIKKMETGKREC
jgi:hypothetical protein